MSAIPQTSSFPLGPIQSNPLDSIAFYTGPPERKRSLYAPSKSLTTPRSESGTHSEGGEQNTGQHWTSVDQLQDVYVADSSLVDHTAITKELEENKSASDTDDGHDFPSLQDTLRRPPAVASIDGTASNVAVSPAPKGLMSPINTEPEPGFNLSTAAGPGEWAFKKVVADVLSDNQFINAELTELMTKGANSFGSASLDDLANTEPVDRFDEPRDKGKAAVEPIAGPGTDTQYLEPDRRCDVDEVNTIHQVFTVTPPSSHHYHQLSSEDSESESPASEDGRGGRSKLKTGKLLPLIAPSLTFTRAVGGHSRKRKSSLSHHDNDALGKRPPKRLRRGGWPTGFVNNNAPARPCVKRAPPSPSSLPAKIMKEQTGLGDINKLPSTIQNTSMNITDITVHTEGSSPELGFLTAVIRNAPSVFSTNGRELLRALEGSALGDMRNLEKISIQPLALGVALLTATTCNTQLAATSSHNRYPTLQADKTETAVLAVGRQLQKKAHTVGRFNDETSSEDDSPSDVDGYSSEDSDSTSDEDDTAGHNAKPLCLAKRLLWTREEDDNLRRWKEGNEDWSWIFSQFPNRTPGAVRTRWHTKFQQKGT